MVPFYNTTNYSDHFNNISYSDTPYRIRYSKSSSYTTSSTSDYNLRGSTSSSNNTKSDLITIRFKHYIKETCSEDNISEHEALWIKIQKLIDIKLNNKILSKYYNKNHWKFYINNYILSTPIHSILLKQPPRFLSIKDRIKKLHKYNKNRYKLI